MEAEVIMVTIDWWRAVGLVLLGGFIVWCLIGPGR